MDISLFVSFKSLTTSSTSCLQYVAVAASVIFIFTKQEERGVTLRPHLGRAWPRQMELCLSSFLSKSVSVWICSPWEGRGNVSWWRVIRLSPSSRLFKSGTKWKLACNWGDMWEWWWCWLVLPFWTIFRYILKDVLVNFCLKFGTVLNKDELGEHVIYRHENKQVHSSIYQAVKQYIQFMFAQTIIQ